MDECFYVKGIDRSSGRSKDEGIGQDTEADRFKDPERGIFTPNKGYGIGGLCRKGMDPWCKVVTVPGWTLAAMCVYTTNRATSFSARAICKSSLDAKLIMSPSSSL